MTQYDQTNRGILSRNDRKSQDTHPDYTGSLNVNGVEMWVDGYTQKTKDGSRSFLSIKVKPKEPKAAPARQQSSADDDGDFPF